VTWLWAGELEACGVHVDELDQGSSGAGGLEPRRANHHRHVRLQLEVRHLEEH
jgi:hypothetical protein